MSDKSRKKGRQTSARKIAANRANAERSTGPKTRAGKDKSRQNALKYGFYARTTLLPGEDPEEFQALVQDLWTGLAPQNMFEALNVSEIASAIWRLQRLGCVEGELFIFQSLSNLDQPVSVGAAFLRDAKTANAFTKLNACEAALTRRLHRAMENLRRARKEGWKEAKVSQKSQPPYCCSLVPTWGATRNEPPKQSVPAPDKGPVEPEQGQEVADAAPAQGPDAPAADAALRTTPVLPKEPTTAVEQSMQRAEVRTATPNSS